MMKRRPLLAGLLAAPAIARPGFAQAPAQSQARSQAPAWSPTRPIRMVVPYPPGGTTDALARPLAARLTEVFGQPVSVDNRGGASGVIGADIVARAPPDGLTLLMTTQQTQTANGLLIRNLPHDVERSFTGITLVADSPIVLVVPGSSPARDMAGLIALARTRPLAYASPSAGAAAHLLGESLNQLTGMNATHVPYRGAAPAITDVVAGVVDFAFASLGSITALAREGRVRMIAVGGDARLPDLPDVPSTVELGLPGLDAGSWWGLFGPAGLPRPVAERLNAETIAAFADPAIRGPLEATGFRIRTMQLDEFRAFHRSEVQRWFSLVQRTGVRIDN